MSNSVSSKALSPNRHPAIPPTLLGFFQTSLYRRAMNQVMRVPLRLPRRLRLVRSVPINLHLLHCALVKDELGSVEQTRYILRRRKSKVVNVLTAVLQLL